MYADHGGWCHGVEDARDEAGGVQVGDATSDVSVTLNKTTEIDTREEEESPEGGGVCVCEGAGEVCVSFNVTRL